MLNKILLSYMLLLFISSCSTPPVGTMEMNAQLNKDFIKTQRYRDIKSRDKKIRIDDFIKVRVFPREVGQNVFIESALLILPLEKKSMTWDDVYLKEKDVLK